MSQYLICPAVNPVDGKTTIEVKISYDRIRALGKRSRVLTYEAARIVPYVLAHPMGIFRGMRFDEDEPLRDCDGAGWLCYCSVPKVAYREDGTTCPPYKGETYLVFVNHDYVAYNWRWEKADEGNPRFPVEHQERFKELML